MKTLREPTTPHVATHESAGDRGLYAGYIIAIVAAVSIWFIAVRAPLWFDETVTYHQISRGLSGVWSRQGLCFPAYAYLLSLSTKVLGNSAIALRFPSILAMLAAVWLLYRAARELFGREVALLAAILFSVYPTVVFASIDIRPYAFALLATNGAILALVRLRHNNSNWAAVLFGFLAALIVYFHYLFAVILPAMAIGFFLFKKDNRTAMWRQAGIALGTFILAFLPVIPGLEYLFHTGRTHVFAPAPKFKDFMGTIAPQLWAHVLMGAVLVAFLLLAVRRKYTAPQSRLDRQGVLLCALLAVVPILILYGVSVSTRLHIFISRYRLAGIPGVAICWALLINVIQPRAIRVLLCLTLVAVTAYLSPRTHRYSWKFALQAVEKNDAAENSPVLLCSNYIESNYTAMPRHGAKQSVLFAPLSYYKITVPVVPLPRALNVQTKQIVSSFLQRARRRHQRFLAVGYVPSYNTLDWIKEKAATAYDVRKLGIFEGIMVLDFSPRQTTQANRQAAPVANQSSADPRPKTHLRRTMQ